jgi:septal ring factor EnvC (AmiA/AmiB activator)
MLKQAEDQNGDHLAGKRQGRVYPFGTTVDPRVAGSRGGKNSQAGRKFREVRKIEEEILATSNGAAKAAVLRIRLDRQAEVERERVRLDAGVRQLRDEADDLRDDIDELRDEHTALQAEVAEFQKHDVLLRAALNAGEAELAERLRVLDEEAGLGPILLRALRQSCETAELLAALLADVPEDRLEAALIALGHQFVEEEVAGAASAEAAA